MKIFIFFIFLFLLSCTNPIGGENRVYICGDHPCANNKEVEEYFDNNISVEVYTIVSDKERKENFDLVELNLLKDKLESKKKIQISKKKKEIKKQIKERKKLAKLKIKKVEEPIKIKEKPKKKDRIQKKKPSKKTQSQFTFVRICKNLEECDINKISKIIMDIGKEKEYPDITN
tara:strand:- start:513 stop:1034 length:522 start_codon:yes stop_codon:yes gene_type:complete